MIEPELTLESEVDSDGDDESTYIHCSVIGADGRNHTASCNLHGDASDQAIALALVRVASAAAQMHSSGAHWELRKLVTSSGTEEKGEKP